MLSSFELPVALSWERLMNGLLWGEENRRKRCDPSPTWPSGFGCQEMQCWYNPAATCCFDYPCLNEAPSKGSVVKKQRTAWLISGFCLAIYNNGFLNSGFSVLFPVQIQNHWPIPLYKLVRFGAVDIRKDLTKCHLAGGCLHST